MFNRAMFDLDVPSGTKKIKVHGKDREVFKTTGPKDSLGWRHKMPKEPANVCSLWNVGGSCTEEQGIAIAVGNATIEDYIVVQPR